MATGLQSWSKTAASNANADSAVNFAEGMAPSAVNDSARGLMASAAKWRDDNAGMITTGGTSTAYTATSNQSLGLVDGTTITLQMSATSGATPTLNVDSGGAKAIQGVSGTAIPTGALLSGGLYKFTYRSGADAWILHGKFDPLSIPPGVIADWAGTSAPAGWILCYGQAISRSTYAVLFANIGTAHGVGDGSTTFNLPDCRGRVVAGDDDMGGSSADRLTGLTNGVDGDTFGAAGGLESTTLALLNLPDHDVTITDTTAYTVPAPGSKADTAVGGANIPKIWARDETTVAATKSGTVTAAFGTTARGGAQTAFNNMQPTIIMNKIIYAGV